MSYLYVIILLVISLSSILAYYLNNKKENEPRELFLRRKLNYEAAKGKRVALFQVHFEGNVGDQMETLPLIRKLNELGAIVDCYLSFWLPIKQRLSPKVYDKVSGMVSHIYEEGIPENHILASRNYDLAIIAPGPAVNELKHCFSSDNRPDQNVSMVYFGVTVNPNQINVYEREKSCLKLIAVREDQSYDFIKKYLPRKDESILELSGDISFSYIDDDYEKPNLMKKFPEVYKAVKYANKQDNDWVLIFTRFNNFGQGKSVNIVDNFIFLKEITGKIVKIDLKKVLIGSSDRNMDNEHFKTLKKNYNLDSRQFCTVDTVEEMFALISSASHVYTDRYHPGVASIILNTKLSVLSYPNEYVKMQGLHSMKSVPNSSIKEMNRKAFKSLENVFKNLDNQDSHKLQSVHKDGSEQSAAPSKIIISHNFGDLSDIKNASIE